MLWRFASKSRLKISKEVIQSEVQRQSKEGLDWVALEASWYMTFVKSGNP
jgi:hypothetical protein